MRASCERIRFACGRSMQGELVRALSGRLQRDTGHLSLESTAPTRSCSTPTTGPGGRCLTSAVHRLTRAVTDSERSAVDSVLSEFWIVSSATRSWTNPRAKAEIDKAICETRGRTSRCEAQMGCERTCRTPDHANASHVQRARRGQYHPPDAIEPDPEPTEYKQGREDQTPCATTGRAEADRRRRFRCVLGRIPSQGGGQEASP